MNNTWKAWISAMRFRTLPLAVSGILLGSGLAEISGYESNHLISGLALLTAVLLQVLSNLANDYGDFTKGTDNENRIGNVRALQSGAITPKAMLKAIIIFTILSLICGLTLLYVSFNGNINLPFIGYFLMGLAAIVAAIKYTVGKTAYGYKGLGDVFVFIFFGPVAVLGIYLLHHGFVWFWPSDNWVILPATAIGLLSAGVLNTNNIRDIENDRNSGKITIVVKMGLTNAKRYHLILLAASFVCMLIYLWFNNNYKLELIALLGFYPIFKQGYLVFITEPSSTYNQYLKQLSLGILFMVVVFMIVKTVSLGFYAYHLTNYFLY